MDSNAKNNFRVDPRPPYAGPSVQAYSVHACNAGNVNARLNHELESGAGNMRVDLRDGSSKP
jgi:hypothetical protein